MPRRGRLTFDPTGASKSGYQPIVIPPAQRRPIRLYPNQKEVALQSFEIAKKYGFFINTSETGAGKTLTTLATGIMLNVPILVIGPPSAAKAWNDTCAKYLTTDYLGFISTEILKNGGILDAIGGALLNKIKVKSGRGESTEFSPTPLWEAICEKGVFLIFDEAHSAKNASLRNTAIAPLLKTLSNYPQSYYALLSATLLDKSDSAMNFASMMGFVNTYQWHRKEAGVDIFDTVHDFVHFCLSKFDYRNESNRTVRVILETTDTVEVRIGAAVEAQTIRKYYNGRPQMRPAAPDEGGNFYYDSQLGDYVIPDVVNPAEPGRVIPFPIITKNNYRDFVADLFFDVVMEFTGVEIENVNIARMAYRGFFEVHPEKVQDMYAAIGDLKSAASRITQRMSGKSYSGVQSKELDFGAVNVAIMHIEEIMAYTYMKLAVEKLKEPPTVLPDGRLRYNRVVLAVNYHSTLEAIRNYLVSVGYGPQLLVYHGKISHDERDDAIDKWNNTDPNNPYRIFLMTAATGGMSISLHPLVETWLVSIFYSPDYQMIKAHQTMGRVFRYGQATIGEGFLVYPKVDEQIDNIMLALARKSRYILRTRRYKTIHDSLLAEGTPKTDVNFPGTYPRYIEGYGYLDEHRISSDCAAKVIPEDHCRAIQDNVVRYVMNGGPYAYTHVPIPPALPRKNEEVVVDESTPENSQLDPDIYPASFTPGFVYLEGSPSLVSRWGDIKKENGKWVFGGGSSSFDYVSAGLPVYMQHSSLNDPMSFMNDQFTAPWSTPSTTPTGISTMPWMTSTTPVTPSVPSTTPWSTPTTPSTNPWETPTTSTTSVPSTTLWSTPTTPSTNPWETPTIASATSGVSSWNPSTSSMPWSTHSAPSTPTGTSSMPWSNLVPSSTPSSPKLTAGEISAISGLILPPLPKTETIRGATAEVPIMVAEAPSVQSQNTATSSSRTSRSRTFSTRGAGLSSRGTGLASRGRGGGVSSSTPSSPSASSFYNSEI